MIGGTTICTFTPWHYITDQKIIQNSQVVKKKLNLKNQEILLAESFLVHNSRNGPEQHKKPFKEKSNNKNFKKI